MHPTRLYIDAPLEPGLELELPAAQAKHVVTVLRRAVGDELTLFNGDGHDYRARLSTIGRTNARVRILSRQPALTESSLRLTLAQGIARGDKMDLVVQKATELGVAEIVPLATARSNVRLDAERAAKRQERWQQIAIAACEQCGRSWVPPVQGPQSLESWLATVAGQPGIRWVCAPGPGQRARDMRVDATQPVTVLIGPEGGLAEVDLQLLDHAGFKHLALGPRILRTETAGLAALAALQACLGDL